MKEIKLRPREIDVWNTSLDGAPFSVIAERLFMTKRTVKWHMESIYPKVGVANRLELVIVQYRDYGGQWLPGGKDRINAAITPHYPTKLKAA
ncbi:helix-turn-helix transcriptional regulator [Alteromonas pelagimontana]|uniref:Helix-turn-helix transcriptional regulator n=1 Tax=Alteromonas pelagimontana TaxID=1858656 RepID=A0A6M4M906_9ALTE|nr:helix-turn-helix transcriptional regulator [Alteromonas pelagimontana]QJR79652.1 helix-turn-helix transcriptional regulator [Alteromonas pelagimontana]